MPGISQALVHLNATSDAIHLSDEVISWYQSSYAL